MTDALMAARRLLSARRVPMEDYENDAEAVARALLAREQAVAADRIVEMCAQIVERRARDLEQIGAPQYTVDVVNQLAADIRRFQ
jgi:hypothetical protein